MDEKRCKRLGIQLISYQLLSGQHLDHVKVNVHSKSLYTGPAVSYRLSLEMGPLLTIPSIYLHLILQFEISSLMNMILDYFKLEFYSL